MAWTRRRFMEVTGGLAAAAGLGIVPRVAGALEGKASFEDWRALPGMQLKLSLDVDRPDSTQVDIFAREGMEEQHLMRLKGAPNLEIPIPFLKTAGDSYMLWAVVSDDSGKTLATEPVEVITEDFHFGM